MEPDVLPAAGNRSSQNRQAPSTRPLISKNLVATIRRPAVLLRLREIRVPAIAEIRAYRSTLRGCASSAFPLAAQVDAGTRASSVTPLTVSRRFNVPAFF